MRITASVLMAGLALGIAGLAAVPARADEWNKEIVFSFNQPVEIPGHVLVPGSYAFKVADLTDRNLVQVFREGRNGREHIVATLFTTPDYRMDATGKPVIHFEERKSDSPEAVHNWFYPGDLMGMQFVYPPSQRLHPAT